MIGIVILVWSGMGLIGLILRLIYWYYNDKSFGDNPPEPITLGFIVLSIILGPLTLALGLIEIIMVIGEILNNITILR